MNLQDKLDGIKEDFEKKAPKEILEIMHRATDDLRNSGILDKAISVGDKAPNFTLKNTRGQAVNLSQKLLKGPLVLGFYRGRW